MIKFTKPPLILIFLNLKKSAKNAKKMEKPKSKSANPKNTKAKQKGKKSEKNGKTKRGKNGEKMDLSICIFFAFFFFFDLLFFAFLLLLFCFFPGKKQNKSKKKQIEKVKKKQQKCKWTSPFFPIFSPFLTFLCFPIYFASCFFFGFEVLLFDFPCVFLFFAFFSSLKNIRTKGRGEHNYMILDPLSTQSVAGGFLAV